MSKNFELLINNLQSDWSLVVEFLSNPEKVVENYNLSSDEKEAILTRDLQGFAALGVDQELAVGALSGAHSQRCTTMPY